MQKTMSIEEITKLNNNIREARFNVINMAINYKKERADSSSPNRIEAQADLFEAINHLERLRKLSNPDY